MTKKEVTLPSACTEWLLGSLERKNLRLKMKKRRSPLEAMTGKMIQTLITAPIEEDIGIAESE